MDKNITGFWDDLEAERQQRNVIFEELSQKCDEIMKRNKEKREAKADKEE